MTGNHTPPELARALREVQRRLDRYIQQPPADMPLTLRIGKIRVRPFSTLANLSLVSGEHQKPLILKLLSDTGTEARLPSPLASFYTPTMDPPRAEYNALRYLQHLYHTSDERFFAVEVLDSFLDGRALVMERVEACSFNQLIARAFRPSMQESVCVAGERIGSWLRIFHDSAASHQAPTRLATRRDVFAWMRLLRDSLGKNRYSRNFFSDIESALQSAIELHLPEDLPVSVVHADFAPRNMLVNRRGQVAGIDTLMEWRSCKWEDLAHFLLALHSSKLRRLSLGSWPSTRLLERLEDRLLLGYFGAADAPRPALAVLQILLALSHWAADVRPATRWPLPGNRARHTAAIVRRLLRELERARPLRSPLVASPRLTDHREPAPCR